MGLLHPNAPGMPRILEMTETQALVVPFRDNSGFLSMIMAVKLVPHFEFYHTAHVLTFQNGVQLRNNNILDPPKLLLPCPRQFSERVSQK